MMDVVHWSPSRVTKTLEKAHANYLGMSEISRSVLGDNVDEISLLFSTWESLAMFVKLAVRHSGYSLFNTATDEVKTGPLPGAYTAEYWFLGTPYQYRIECMVITDGHSPLHAAANHLRRLHGAHDPFVIHASFKVSSEEEYADSVLALRNELVLYQECESTYGRFSYWAPAVDPKDESDFSHCFLKPRVNLRDAS
jgi:hypothetical protein